MASMVAQENTPLLVEVDIERHGTRDGDSTSVVNFDSNGDPDNPLEWSASSKRGIVAMLSFAAFTVTFNCVSVVPAASRIAGDLNGGSGSKLATVLLVTIWELGEAAGPLLIAPLSEIFGRYPLINAANLLFIVAMVLTALSQSTALFIFMRGLTGMAVASNVLGPAIIGDIFVPDQRGTAMSLVMLTSLVGGAVGPAISGAVAQSLGWRAVIWIGVALAVVCEFVTFAFFRETYKVPILRRRAARLRKETGNTSITGTFGKEKDFEKRLYSLRTSIMRPAAVLFSSGVLAALSLFGSLVYAYFYVVAVTLPDILEERYRLSQAAVGSAFLANSVGSFIGTVICKMCLDKIYTKLRAANDGIGLPEYRLPMTIIGAVSLPPAVALYGWCAEYELPLTLLLLSVIWIRVSLILAFLPLMAYIVDACDLFAASALTGFIVMRCLTGAFLPLTTTMMIEELGYGWGLTLLGAFTLALALIPMMILRHGSHWRQRSKYTRTA